MNEPGQACGRRKTHASIICTLDCKQTTRYVIEDHPDPTRLSYPPQLAHQLTTDSWASPKSAEPSPVKNRVIQFWHYWHWDPIILWGQTVLYMFNSTPNLCQLEASNTPTPVTKSKNISVHGHMPWLITTGLEKSPTKSWAKYVILGLCHYVLWWSLCSQNYLR